MDSRTRKFILEETRSSEGAIVDARGRIGYWPLRRAISYHVGVNCDSICVRDDLLHVQRRGRTIATAELLGVPSQLSRLLRACCEALLHPRHASKHECAPANGEGTPVRWEQLLQPRDKDKR
jgi:hypothetical protein